MPFYSYTAISSSGEHFSKIREASDEHELARLIREDGHILVSSEEQGIKKGPKILVSIKEALSSLSGVPLIEKIVFLRSTRVMVMSGLSLPRALSVSIAQTKSKRFRIALTSIREDVIQGKTLSEAMEKYPDIFSPIFSHMIRAGEESGGLDQVIESLILQMEREYDIKSKVRGALMYPSVVFVAMIGIAILMLVMVVPQLEETFLEMGANLPVATQFMIGLKNFLFSFWYVLVFIVIVAIGGLLAFRRTPKGKKVESKVLLFLPVIGDMTRKTNAALTVRTLSSLISAGVPIARSLEITSAVVSNSYFEDSLLKASQNIRKGEKLSQTLRNYEFLYPALVLQMLEAGEETGQTAEIFRQLADFLEEEVATMVKNISSLIEPVLMLMIGIGVGFFAISMLQPMYSMLQHIK
ncbi:MAG: type II secretion system F family protein [bacterium]|nr:type II secretion system F family protein [bacterium]